MGLKMTLTNELDYGNKMVIWTFGRLKECVDLGILTEGSTQIAPKGIALYDQIEQDFEPLFEDVMGVLSIVCDNPEDVPLLASLLFKIKE
jgi:hypothetical protein